MNFSLEFKIKSGITELPLLGEKTIRVATLKIRKEIY